MIIRTSFGEAAAFMVAGIVLIILRKSIGNALRAFVGTFIDEVGIKSFKLPSEAWATGFLMVMGILFTLAGGIGIIQHYLKR